MFHHASEYTYFVFRLQGAFSELIPLSKSIYAKRTISHSGRDERLLVLGTQTRAPPMCLLSLIGFNYFSTMV
jgi:hypothetical protein